MPLEVEVSADPGLYSPQNVLDFGVLHSQSDPKTLPLFVINSSIKHIEIAVSYYLNVEIRLFVVSAVHFALYLTGLSRMMLI